jgi:hypothetical protein
VSFGERKDVYRESFNVSFAALENTTIHVFRKALVGGGSAEVIPALTCHLSGELAGLQRCSGGDRGKVGVKVGTLYLDDTSLN